MKLFIVLFISLFSLQYSWSQSKQHLISTELTEFVEFNGINFQYELGLSDKFGVFTSILFQREDALSNLMVDSSGILTFDKVGVSLVDIRIGGSYYFNHLKYQNTGHYLSLIFDFRRFFNPEEGSDLMSNSYIDFGLGYGYRWSLGRFFIDPLATLTIDKDITNGGDFFGPDFDLQIRVGYIINPASADRRRTRSRRSRRR